MFSVICFHLLLVENEKVLNFQLWLMNALKSNKDGVLELLFYLLERECSAVY